MNETEKVDASRELDLDLISTSWRSLTDDDSFYAMMAVWERKLSLAQSSPSIPLLDGALQKHLGAIGQLLTDRRDIQIEDPLDIVLSETPAPAMVLSPNGLVADLNYGAAAYFGVEQGAMAGTQWLRVDSRADYQAVRDAGVGKGNADYAIVRTNNPADQLAFAEVFKLNGGDVRGSYTVVRSLELEWDDSISPALNKAFGLTHAECEVCELLFALRDLDLIAQKRTVALGTVRMQVKSILSKTEVHSKTELVRLLAQLCARAATKRAQKDLSWTDPLGNERIFQRSDGRRLAYTWCGAKDGKPILYLPDHTSPGFFPERVSTLLQQNGIKLWIVSLPGFGSSDPAERSAHFVDCCSALEEWCEALSTPLCGVLGGRAAQFYLIYMAMVRPDLFPGLLCVGLPWNITPKREAEMSMVDRTLLTLCQEAPFAYDIAIKIGYKSLRKHGPDGYWRMVFAANEADRRTTRDLDALPLLRATVRHLYAQGYEALKRAQEVCACHSPSDWVKQLRVPVHWIVPEMTSTLSADDLDEITQLNSLVSVEVIPDSGELMPFQNPETFAKRIIMLAA
ncbi:MAG: alpha/beta hydrolase [Pseudomonadota bacterium]